MAFLYTQLYPIIRQKTIQVDCVKNYNTRKTTDEFAFRLETTKTSTALPKLPPEKTYLRAKNLVPFGATSDIYLIEGVITSVRTK